MIKQGDIGMDDPVKPVTGAELEIAFSGSAIASNRFFITVGPTVRIAFCEQLGEEVGPKFRTAVSLPIQDAIALVEVLQKLLAPIEAKITQEIRGRAPPTAGNG
jgi:hypothetical protein